MPVLVVDGLEEVQVDETQAQRQAQPGAQGDLRIQEFLSAAPVGQAGECVVGGQVLELELQHLLLGDVVHHADHARGLAGRIAMADPPAVTHPQVVAIAIAQPVLGHVAVAPPLQVVVQDAHDLRRVIGMDVGGPGFQARGHLIGAVAEHALQLGAEEQRVVGQRPVPQAVGGLVQRKPQCRLTALQFGFQLQAPRDVARHRQEVLAPVQHEGGGDHFHRHFVAVAVAVAADEDIGRLLADRGGDRRPLRQAAHILLQAEHRVVQHLFARQPQHRPGRAVGPQHGGSLRVQQVDGVRHLVEERGGRGNRWRHGAVQR